MASVKDKETVLALRVALTPKQIELLERTFDGEDGTAEKLGRGASRCLQDLADGGMLVSPTTMAQIEEIAGPVNLDTDLLPLIEKATSRRGGRVVVEWVLDPVWIPPLQEIAARQEVTIEQLAQNCFEYIMSQGWLYDLDCEPKVFRIAREDEAELEQILERKNLTGTDLVEWIRKQSDPLPALTGG